MQSVDSAFASCGGGALAPPPPPPLFLLSLPPSPPPRLRFLRRADYRPIPRQAVFMACARIVVSRRHVVWNRKSAPRRKRGLPNRLVHSLIGFPQQIGFRPEGEQQPQKDNEPTVILPLPADFVFPKPFSQKQRQNQQTAGAGHGQKHFPHGVHGFSRPLSSSFFSSSYSSSASKSPIIRLETSPFALPS